MNLAKVLSRVAPLCMSPAEAESLRHELPRVQQWSQSLEYWHRSTTSVLKSGLEELARLVRFVKDMEDRDFGLDQDNLVFRLKHVHNLLEDTTGNLGKIEKQQALSKVLALNSRFIGQ